MIIAGEISGDMHAAEMIEALRRRCGGVRLFGIGGERMRAAGVETLYDVRDMAVVGVSEVFRKYRFLKSVFRQMLRAIEERSPQAVILVDYPGFNLRFAARAHAKGLKVIYYICPQVWAWNRARIPRMARVVDHLITIFPFEAGCFARTNVKVSFAGHPLVDMAREIRNSRQPELPWPGRPRIAVLPGSRSHEVRNILPAMWNAARLLANDYPEAGFVIASPSEAIEKVVREVLAGTGEGPLNSSVTTGRTPQVLSEARAAMVASGTATVETALMSCPMVIAYKVSAITYLLARMVITVPHIGMVNLVAGREVCPEFIQSAATPAALASALKPLIDEGDERARMLRDLSEVGNALGSGGAGGRAADIVISELGLG
jgi:lipid-A-disaccharide synthase